MSKWIEQLNSVMAILSFGTSPEPCLKPPIDKELELWRKEKLDAIEDEFHQFFDENK